MDQLLERVGEALPGPSIEVRLLLPFERTDVLAMLYRDGRVLDTEEAAEGMKVHAMVPASDVSAMQPFLARPVRRRVPAT